MAASEYRPDREAEVGLREGGRVVDPVPDHGHHAGPRPAGAARRRPCRRAAPRLVRSSAATACAVAAVSMSRRRRGRAAAGDAWGLRA